MYMDDWIESLDRFLKLGKREVLAHAQRLSSKTAELKVKKNIRNIRLYISTLGGCLYGTFSIFYN